MEKIIFNGIQDLLDYRIERETKIKDHRKSEAKFCDSLDDDLKEILINLDYQVISIKREFELELGRIDYLCKLNNGEYLIIEVKAENTKSNKDLVFSFALGQLLTYRTLFSRQYEISKEKIHLMLLTNEDSAVTLSVINDESMDIDMLVVLESGVKYYGTNRQTKERNQSRAV